MRIDDLCSYTIRLYYDLPSPRRPWLIRLWCSSAEHAVSVTLSRVFSWDWVLRRRFGWVYLNPLHSGQGCDGIPCQFLGWRIPLSFENLTWLQSGPLCWRLIPKELRDWVLRRLFKSLYLIHLHSRWVSDGISCQFIFNGFLENL